jgi:hypothetical protein
VVPGGASGRGNVGNARGAIITVTVNQESVTKLLGRLSGLQQDATPVMRAMGMALKSVTEGTFNS